MISSDDVKKLAALSRIKLVAGDEKKLAADMENILDYIKQIQEVGSAVPKQHKERLTNVLRDDTHPHESGIHTEAILAEAPKRKGQYVEVKKIL